MFPVNLSLISGAVWFRVGWGNEPRNRRPNGREQPATLYRSAAQDYLQVRKRCILSWLTNCLLLVAQSYTESSAVLCSRWCIYLENCGKIESFSNFETENSSFSYRPRSCFPTVPYCWCLVNIYSDESRNLFKFRVLHWKFFCALKNTRKLAVEDV